MKTFFEFILAFGIALITLFTRLLFVIFPSIPRWIVDKRIQVQDMINPKDQLIIEARELPAPVIRSVLPKNLSWFGTPDQTLPGGMYEPTVLEYYKTYGTAKTAAMWIGRRNVLHGLAWEIGRECTNFYEVLTSEERKKQRLVHITVPLLFFKLIIRHTTYQDWYKSHSTTGFWAVPTITLRGINQK